jgi:hypothetical protein
MNYVIFAAIVVLAVVIGALTLRVGELAHWQRDSRAATDTITLRLTQRLDDIQALLEQRAAEDAELASRRHFVQRDAGDISASRAALQQRLRMHQKSAKPPKGQKP